MQVPFIESLMLSYNQKSQTTSTRYFLFVTNNITSLIIIKIFYNFSTNIAFVIGFMLCFAGACSKRQSCYFGDHEIDWECFHYSVGGVFKYSKREVFVNRFFVAQDIKRFAEDVVGYMMLDPHSLGHEFMYRVDIFEYEGMLKLNEVESFDANVRSYYDTFAFNHLYNNNDRFFRRNRTGKNSNSLILMKREL